MMQNRKFIPVFATLMLLVACTSEAPVGPPQPVLPEVTPSYRTATATVFDISFPSEDDAPYFDERAQLGRVLFHDRMLSQNGAVSCNSCHLQSHGFAEPKALSTGLRRELTERNASHLGQPRQPVRLFLGR